MDRFQRSSLINSNMLHMQAQPEHMELVRKPSSKQTGLSQQNPTIAMGTVFHRANQP